MGHLPSYSDTLYADIQPSYTDYLYHHGIKGQKWGVRRFQNTDGTLTNAGKNRTKANRKKRMNSDAAATALLLGAGVIAPLAIGAYSSYSMDVRDFDQCVKALTGPSMQKTIDSTKDRKSKYDSASAYFKIAYAQGTGASYSETRPISEIVRRDIKDADSSLSEAKNALRRMESKKGLLKTKKRQDDLARARNKVSELENETSRLKFAANDLNQAMASANWKYYDSDFGPGRNQKTNSRNTNGNSNNKSSGSTDGDRRAARYGRKSTAQTKSKDRVDDMKARGVKVGTAAEESKKVRDLSSRIQQAQREGKDTTKLVQELQDARARKKIAVERESMQHGFVCTCRRSIAIL